MARVKNKFLAIFSVAALLALLPAVSRADFTISAGTFGVVQGATFDSSGSIVLNGGLFSATGTIKLTGNWNKTSSGIFVPNSSTVTFYNVMASSLTGNTTFNVLSCVEAGKTLFFQNGSTQGINAVLTLTGASGNLIKLRPTLSGTTWYIRLLSSQTVTFVDVQNSSAVATTNIQISANNSTDSGGNNSRWSFAGNPSPPSGLAQYVDNFMSLPFGNWTQYQQIRATFTLSDPNSGDLLQFNIQFSTYPDFSTFLYINSTSPASATLAQGATNFLTAQAQATLPQGTWYWRVMATDNSGLSGSFSSGTVVNGINFGVDFTSPTGHAITAVTAWLSSVTINLSVAVDTVSGPNALPNSIRYSTSSDFVSLVSTNSGWFSGTSTQTYLGLAQNTTYFFQTQARDVAVNLSSWTGGASSTFTSVTLSAVPTPSPFAPADVGVNSVILSWSANNNPSGTFYEADVSTSSDFVRFSSQTTTAGVTITTATLPRETTYYFRVKSRNHESLFSSWSATVSTQTIDPAPPGQISDLTAITGSGSGQVNLSWTAPGNDGTSGNITAGFYDIRYKTTQIANETDFNSATKFNTLSTNTVLGQSVGITVTGLTSQTLYYFAVKTQDHYGYWSSWSQGGGVNGSNSATASGHGAITIDGSAADWNALPASLNFNAGAYLNGEWIWRDKVGDDRTDSKLNRDIFDLTEVHAFADATNLYFLFKLKDMTMTTNDTAYIGIQIETGSVSGTMAQAGVLWGPGDDSGMTQLGHPDVEYGGAQIKVTRQVVIHSSQTAWTAVEYFDGEGTGGWYAPPSGFNAFNSPTNSLIEVRMNRADLALTGSKVFRFTLDVFENQSPPEPASGPNGTKSYNPNALDSMSIMRFWHPTTDVPNRNDWNNDKNAWWDDISDSDNDFWVQISLDANGIVEIAAAGAPTLNLPANAISTNTLTPSLQWTGPGAPAAPNAITSYLIEVGTSSDLSGPVSWRINLQSSSSSWTVPQNLQNNTTYYWRVSTRDRAGALTAASAFSFVTNNTAVASGSGTPPFSPTIDGLKESAWGTSPIATSPESKEPVSNNLADDLYLTNDAGFLYIGWKFKGDPWQNSVQPDTAFILETNGDARGTTFDPWRINSTKLNWNNAPDFWVNISQPEPGSTINSGRLFQSIISTTPGVMGWDSGTLLDSVSNNRQPALSGDSSNSWAEFSIPLKVLNLVKDRLVNILMATRPGSTGAPTGFTANNGYNDSTPFDFGQVPSSATSDFAHVKDGTVATFNSTASVTYRIQFSTMDAEHTPNSVPVVGQGTMRNPLNPSSGDSANIKISITPQNIFDTGEVRYSTGSVWKTTNTVSFGGASNSGVTEFRTATIPTFPKNNVVKYYALASANGMDTYAYGPGDGQTFTTRFATIALNSAWSYTVTNGSPTAPTSVTLTPANPRASDNLFCAASGAADPDGDVVTLITKWYRNGLLFATTSQLTAVSTRPASDTSSGEQWFCTVQSSDTGGLLSSISTSNAVAILSQVWLGTAPTKVNVSTFSLNPSSTEFIWLDKTGDAPDSNADLKEVRIKFDSVNAYFLFKFRDITDANNPFIAITVDTNTTPNSGSAFVGDDSNLTLGVEYSTTAGTNTGGYQALWERQIILHSTATASNSFAVEISSNGNWVVPLLSRSSAAVFPDADIVEAGINREDMGLTGTSARFAIATFLNNPGRAATAATTSGGAQDSVSIARISTGTQNSQYTNDPSETISSDSEELSDSDLDFWFGLLTDNTDTSPPAPFNPFPLNGGTTSSLTPTLSWSQTLSGTGFAVTSFLVELNDSTNLDGTVKWRVNVSTNRFTLPTNLKGATTYYWRAWARNRKGVVTPSTETWSFYVDSEEPFANTPQDTSNLDNFGQTSGDEDADGNVLFTWAPVAVSSFAITNYIIEVSSTSTFDFKISSDVGKLLTSTFTALSRGQTWYARAKAKNSANVTGPYSPISDGIYVAARTVDGNLSDWATGVISSNTAIVLTTGAASWGEMVWKDAIGDQRKDGPDSNQLDLSTFAVTADARNLYMYFTFASTTSAGFDGRHFIQVGIDNDFSSKQRVFQGRQVLDQDVYASADVPWEWNVRVRSGSGSTGGDCRIIDNNFKVQKTEAYKANISANAFEVAVPLADMGGASKFLGKNVNFTVIVSSRQSDGEVGQWATAISTPHAVDVVSAVDGSDPTWSEVQDSVVDFYLKVSFGVNGQVTQVTPVTPTHYDKPAEILPNNEVPQSVRDRILYNMFVEHFSDGDPTNDNPTDPLQIGGDFQGVIDKTSWLNQTGINTIYFSPVTYFGGGGVWGYDVKDPFRVEDHYGGYYDFMRMEKHLRYHNIKTTMDLVPGQATGAAVTDHPNAYATCTGGNCENFGSKNAFVGQAEHQQLWSDIIRWWMGLGMVGFRWDNPKYWFCCTNGSGQDDRHISLRAIRNKIDKDYPWWYTYGELPTGGDVDNTYSNYVNAIGLELHAAEDFRTTAYGIWQDGNAPGYQPCGCAANDGTAPAAIFHWVANGLETAAGVRTRIEVADGSANNQAMLHASRFLNHDNGRWWPASNNGTGDIGKYVAGYAVILGAGTEVPILMFGDEIAAGGGCIKCSCQ